MPLVGVRGLGRDDAYTLLSGIVLGRIEMPMRGNVGVRFHSVEQPVAGFVL